MPILDVDRARNIIVLKRSMGTVSRDRQRAFTMRKHACLRRRAPISTQVGQALNPRNHQHARCRCIAAWSTRGILYVG